ncbi:MMPL family transporter [Thermomonospora catenispora]|uniref:MMPL family transporter n=1 Tax=Thermomonospora catenispora TaxID=2493090 RepID=UPI00111FB10A|nr:MMPL family transporter [Thermomonospora catenispora]TNY36750.1 MMPL family transporter [Thermomonospora catenispora]
MAGFLDALGRWCVRRRRLVFELWIVAILGIGFLGLAHGGVFVQQSSLPGTETQRALDLIAEDFPALAGPTTTVVFTARDEPGAAKPGDWRVALAIGRSIDNLARLDRTAYVENPYVPGMGGLKSHDAVAVRVSLKGTMSDISRADLEQFDRAVEPARMAGLDVEVGGIVAMLLNQPRGGAGEALGLMVALLVLLLAFGSYLAACVPIAASLCALAVSYSLIHYGASVLEIHPTAPMAAAMLGLGAGIDYALFIVTRYRQQLAEGDDVETAVGRAMAHSGHAVVFAGGTVVFAICGLFLSGIAFVGRIGIAAALAVAVMVLAALTLLPAILGAIGDRIDRYMLPRVRPDRASGRWMRWGRHVDRHAWPYAIGATLLLLLCAVPALDLKFGVMSDSTASTSMSSRRAYDAVAENFGPGHYSPWVVVAKVPGTAPEQSEERGRSAGQVPVVEGLAGLGGLTVPPSSPAPEPDPAEARRAEGGGAPMELKKPSPEARRIGQEIRQAVANVPGIAQVGEPIVSGETAVVRVMAAHAPHEQAAIDLVHRLRSQELPEIARAHPGALVYLGGENPAIIDLAVTVGDRMPIVVVSVVVVALVLLIVAFRAILVPVKAALMNLLSIGASYGVVTAVFQWGWGVRLFGLDQAVPIVSFVPLFMFALIFGLSMDYEVFLLSRIKEEYDRTGDPRGSVVVGIGATARLITSAALIMISVFLSFVPQPDPTVKMVALGLAVAVVVDATIVRMVLVPALMSLLGHANWWFPGRSRPRAAERPGPAAVGLEKDSRSLESVG